MQINNITALIKMRCFHRYLVSKSVEMTKKNEPLYLTDMEWTLYTMAEF